jgi:hypothetical protein
MCWKPLKFHRGLNIAIHPIYDLDKSVDNFEAELICWYNLGDKHSRPKICTALTYM